jgi:uncharacterized protein
MALAGLMSAIPGALTARHAGGSLVVGGVDLLAGLASQSIFSFAYTDNTSDMADDLSVQIADPARTWMQNFLPKKGVECTAQIKVFNWKMPGDTRQIDCGVFWLDQIDFKGPPNTVSISASSVPVISGIKNQKKFRSWENQDLTAIAQQIASDNSLTLMWDTKQNPKIQRTDQVDSADLEYIRDKVKECSLSLKIFKRQLVVYSEEEYEARPPVYLLTYGMANILNYSFSSKLDDTYKSATNAYLDPDTGKVLESTFEPGEMPEGTGSELMLNESIDGPEEGGEGGEGGGTGNLREGDGGFIDYTTGSQAGDEAAKIKTKAKLRDKNKREKESSILMVGNPGYISGLNVQIAGFGNFDGKWFISSSIHQISPTGYTTELKMRACLSGY